MPPKKNNPPKKQKTRDITSFFYTSDNPGSSQSTESTRPGGAAGGAKSGAAGSDAGGAAGGAKSGAAGSDPGRGAKFSQPSRSEGSNRGGATGSQTRSQARVKEENGVDLMGKHLHRITLKFSTTDSTKYTIDCDHPCTVLEVIKSTENYEKKMKKHSHENIVIQLGKARAYIVATHFPCTCIREGESLVISGEPEKVEVARNQLYRTIQSRDKYSVFYIDIVGGLFTKQKKLFRNNAVKKFKYLCVYGEKGMTVKEALERDGRFIDELGSFTLTDNADPDSITECTQKVDNLHQKHFKMRLPRNKGSKDRLGSSNNSTQRCDTTPVVDEAQQRKIRAAVEKRAISLRVVMEKSGNSVRAVRDKSGNSVDNEEIYKILCQQFPDLKKFMESRFPGDSYQKALKVKKENFGKIQQSFSEVHRVSKLLKLGESVCKVVVKDRCQGTGFVLFDNFILTNAHLFKGCVEGQKLKEGTDVYVSFQDPEPKDYNFNLAHRSLICYSDGKLDYAVVEIMPEGKNYNHKSKKITQMKVPPGLLKIFGPMPQNGEACLIGHPAGGVKKMDPTCVIEKEYKDYPFTLCAINHVIHADSFVFYNTFMYHGSSGSPVFDAQGKVFGLHTGTFWWDPKSEESVIEFSQSLLTIFEHFVSTLKVTGEDELLKRVNKEVKGNSDLEKLFKSGAEQESRQTHEEEPSDSEELMDIESIDTD